MTHAELKEAVKHLYNWKQYGKNDNFHNLLYSLIAKSDSYNLLKFEKGFPEEVKAYRLWQESSDEDAFFKGWEVK